MGIKRTVKTWEGLSSVMSDVRFNKNPIVISFKEDELDSLIFETISGYKRYEVINE